MLDIKSQSPKRNTFPIEDMSMMKKIGKTIINQITREEAEEWEEYLEEEKEVDIEGVIEAEVEEEEI